MWSSCAKKASQKVWNCGKCFFPQNPAAEHDHGKIISPCWMDCSNVVSPCWMLYRTSPNLTLKDTKSQSHVCSATEHPEPLSAGTLVRQRFSETSVRWAVLQRAQRAPFFMTSFLSSIVANSERPIYFMSYPQIDPKLPKNVSESISSKKTVLETKSKKTCQSLEPTFFNEDNGPLGLILGLSFQTKEATKLVNSCIT